MWGPYMTGLAVWCLQKGKSWSLQPSFIAFFFISQKLVSEFLRKLPKLWISHIFLRLILFKLAFYIVNLVRCFYCCYWNIFVCEIIGISVTLPLRKKNSNEKGGGQTKFQIFFQPRIKILMENKSFRSDLITL